MSQQYSDPKRASEPTALPDVEVFYVTAEELHMAALRRDGSWLAAITADMYHDIPSLQDCQPSAGWYYWSCLPGCLPDSDPIGPFDTEELAIAAAQEDSADESDEDDETTDLNEYLDERARDDEPDEDSITTEDHERFYQYGKLVLEREHDRKHNPDPTDTWYLSSPTGRRSLLGEYDTCEQALRAYMDRVQFWPDVFWVSDHGNAHRINLSEK